MGDVPPYVFRASTEAGAAIPSGGKERDFETTARELLAMRDEARLRISFALERANNYRSRPSLQNWIDRYYDRVRNRIMIPLVRPVRGEVSQEVTLQVKEALHTMDACCAELEDSHEQPFEHKLQEIRRRMRDAYGIIGQHYLAIKRGIARTATWQVWRERWEAWPAAGVVSPRAEHVQNH